MRYTIFILCMLLTISNGHALEDEELSELETALASERREPFEFKFTRDELEEMSKWKNKSFEEMFDDAFNCDRAALYMVGLNFLTGASGLTIDVQRADVCFLKSASLGFAPALKQIIHKNIEEENFFQILIYSNVMTSLGHFEYVEPYHTLRSNTLNNFGNGVVKEVERIAACKKELINNNIIKLSQCKDKNRFFVEMSSDGSLIDHDDDQFDQNYWFRFTKHQEALDNEVHSFMEIFKNKYQAFSDYYEKSKKNLSEALGKIRNNESIIDVKVEFLRHTKNAIGITEEIISSFEKHQNISNEILRKLAKEYLLLSQNAKGVLEQHYKFFTSPSEFLNSKDSISKFAEYTAGVNEHSENIEKIRVQLEQ